MCSFLREVEETGFSLYFRRDLGPKVGPPPRDTQGPRGWVGPEPPGPKKTSVSGAGLPTLPPPPPPQGVPRNAVRQAGAGDQWRAAPAPPRSRRSPPCRGDQRGPACSTCPGTRSAPPARASMFHGGGGGGVTQTRFWRFGEVLGRFGGFWGLGGFHFSILADIPFLPFSFVLCFLCLFLQVCFRVSMMHPPSPLMASRLKTRPTFANYPGVIRTLFGGF